MYLSSVEVDRAIIALYDLMLILAQCKNRDKQVVYLQVIDNNVYKLRCVVTANRVYGAPLHLGLLAIEYLTNANLFVIVPHIFLQSAKHRYLQCVIKIFLADFLQQKEH